jgi:tetratricopeptide (TPR) repeat protein
VTEQPNNQRIAVLISVVLAVITMAVYLPAVRHDFVQYDDQQYVTENPQVQAGLTLSGLRWAFGFHAGNWHPLAWLSHMLDCQLFGANPSGHHFTSILLHVLNTVLLFFLLRRLTGATWRSAIVAGLFAWHPLHVESVAWVAERKDVLCAFFWMISLLSYAKYAEYPSMRNYFATLGCFMLALMAKPMAVTLPFVLLLLDFWPLNRFRGKSFWQLLGEKIPFLIATFAVCLLTIFAQEQAIASTAGLSISQRLVNVAVAYAHYVVALFAPINLAVFYPYQRVFPAYKILISLTLLAAITWLAITNLRRRPYVIVGWLWYLGMLVPVIGLVQVGDQSWADRYTYLPMIGLFLFLVWGFSDWFGQRTRLAVFLVVIMCIAMLAKTSLQLRHWKNTRTLFDHAAKVTRNNPMAATILGSLLAQEGRFDEAIQHFRRALRYNSGYAEAHFFLGYTLDKQGRLEDAVEEYRKALRFKPMQEQTHIFLAISLAKQKKLEEAAFHYRQSIKINPDSAVAQNNLARVLHSLGDFKLAVEHYENALRIDPKLAIAHNNFGILLIQRGELVKGEKHLREALRLKPENIETEFNLALALNQQRRWDEAAVLFKKISSNYANDPKARYEFGLALYRLNKVREAMSEFASAILIQPDFSDALDGLAWILSTDTRPSFRNGKEAVPMAERASQLTGRNDPIKLRTLAAAYAEVGRFDEAISTINEAKTVAAKVNQPDDKYELMLERFLSGESWRE